MVTVKCKFNVKHKECLCNHPSQRLMIKVDKELDNLDRIILLHAFLLAETRLQVAFFKNLQRNTVTNTGTFPSDHTCMYIMNCHELYYMFYCGLEMK